jgi:hypothetical protein
VSARLGAAHLEVDDFLRQAEQLVVLHGEVLCRPYGARKTEKVAAFLRLGRDHHSALLVDEHGWVHLEVGAQHGDVVRVQALENEDSAGTWWGSGFGVEIVI